MGFVLKAFSFALLILLAAASFAFTVDSPSRISVGETPQDYTIRIENTSTLTKPLTAEFILPSRFDILEQPQFIGPKGKGEIRIRIYPEERLEGTEYTGKITLTLGGDVAEKIITISYFSENGCTIDARSGFAPAKAQGTAGNADFIETFTFTNNSYKSKKLTLIGMKGGQQGWKASAAGAFEVGPFETRSFEVPIDAPSAFDGRLEFIFSCANSQLSKKQDVSVKQGAGAGTDVIASGFAVISGAMKSSEAEFILNAFLVVIAAVLLIAFIARLVNFANRKNGGGA